MQDPLSIGFNPISLFELCPGSVIREVVRFLRQVAYGDTANRKAGLGHPNPNQQADNAW